MPGSVAGAEHSAVNRTDNLPTWGKLWAVTKPSSLGTRLPEPESQLYPLSSCSVSGQYATLGIQFSHLQTNNNTPLGVVVRINHAEGRGGKGNLHAAAP